MIVVSNTSPLIFLSNVDSLDLLSSCFDEIYIPEEVKTEFGEKLPNAFRIKAISREGENLVNLQYGALHRGELEVIQLAHEIGAGLVLLDDLLARKKAKIEKLNVMGTLGVFLTASYKGVISPKTAIEKIETLICKHEMFVAPNLLKKVRKELEEII